MTDPYPPGAAAPAPEPGKGRKRLGAREIGALVVFVLLVVFIVENTRKVRIRFIFPEFDAPLFVALLVAALVGALVLWLVEQRVRTRRKKKGNRS